MTDNASSSPGVEPSLDNVKRPSECVDMTDVREGVDAVDVALIALLSLRFGYMNAAARIKPEREAVRDEDRKQQVIDNVRAAAAAAGVPEALIAELWDRLIEGSIAYEMDEWERLRP